MPYEVVPLVASVVLAVRYLRSPNAAAAAKCIVGTLVLLSAGIWWRTPRWIVAATLLQVGVSLFVLVWFRVSQRAS